MSFDNNVFLRVNNREWGGWTSIRISAGIERLARDFNVEITRDWPGYSDQLTPQPPIKKGDLVEVRIGNDLVLTGYVEATPVRYDAKNINTAIAGRSKTGDLIDCSAMPAQYYSRTIAQIAAALAEPFSINVIDNYAGNVLQAVQAERGESVHDVLNKMLGLVQALAYDNERGDLVISGIGSERANTALVLGQNILSCDTEQSIRERFSFYRVGGQRAGNNDDFGDATIAVIRGETSDTAIPRYRPLFIRQTGNSTSATCASRAEFEARQRAAKTDETTYKIQGWRQGDGTLWKPNLLVTVHDPVLNFNNKEMVISEVTFQQNDAGTITELRVGPADAYLPEPPKPGRKKKSASEGF